jgi:hypothetical protein
MRSGGWRRGGCVQRREIDKARSRASSSTAQAMLAMARIFAALLVGFTRIPSSIEVRQF